MKTSLIRNIYIWFSIILFIQCNQDNDRRFNFDENTVMKALSENTSVFTYYCLNSPCGQNAICHPKRLVQYCTCKCGFWGNPYEGCNPLVPAKVTRVFLQLIININTFLGIWRSSWWIYFILWSYKIFSNIQ